MAGRRRAIVQVAVALVAGASLIGTIGIFVADGGADGHAPSHSSPPWPLLAAAPGVYDAAENADLWLLAGGATWSYAGGSWSNLTPTAGIPRNMEENSRMVYDAAGGAVVLYGGEGPRLPFPRLNDTWLFSDGRWVNETSVVRGAPPAGILGLMAYDSADGVVVLYGEQATGQSQPFGATWEYSDLRWTNESVSGPRPIVSSSQPDTVGFADDPSAGYVVFYSIFGGCSSVCPILWTYAAGVWTNRTATVSPLPALTLFASFTYDSTAHEIVAAGGCEDTATYACPVPYGTFTFDDGSWAVVTGGAGLPPSELASFVDDPADGGVMVVNGCCWADYSGLSLMWQDVWVFADDQWTERLPWGGGSPDPVQNDGLWIAIGTVGVPALLVSFPPRARPPERAPR